MNTAQAFAWVVGLVVAQRLSELVIAKRNTARLISHGAIEVGSDHYWMLIALHSAFFVSLISEAYWRHFSVSSVWRPLAVIFAFAQLARVWIIASMQGRWTTRIIVIPGASLVRKGLFRWIAHPNYCVVALELAVLPLIFELWFTAITFTILNALVLLRVRIPQESKALAEASDANYFANTL